jgi:propionyl-CoA:succinyl-CoA transferase
VPLHDPLTKLGMPYAVVDPRRIMGIIQNNEPDRVAGFSPPDARSRKIADYVLNFLLGEMWAKRIPKEFLPLQAGVGNVANAVMGVLGESPEIPSFKMYTEVFQDSLVALMEQGKLTAASTTSLTLTPETLQQVYDNMDFFAPRIVLRPQEISNHAGVVLRLGVIAMNTALEVDIYGNVNSSHVFGTDIMNGVGGSGEFTRNGYLSIYMCPSIAKGGKISSIVPMCPHIDNNEHSVQIVVTDQGLADLRGLGPMQRAAAIIENCAHPAYRDYLCRYIEKARVGHIRHDLETCYELHLNLMEQGAMLPDLDLSGI